MTIRNSSTWNNSINPLTTSTQKNRSSNPLSLNVPTSASLIIHFPVVSQNCHPSPQDSGNKHKDDSEDSVYLLLQEMMCLNRIPDKIEIRAMYFFARRGRKLDVIFRKCKRFWHLLFLIFYAVGQSVFCVSVNLYIAYFLPWILIRKLKFRERMYDVEWVDLPMRWW